MCVCLCVRLCTSLSFYTALLREATLLCFTKQHCFASRSKTVLLQFCKSILSYKISSKGRLLSLLPRFLFTAITHLFLKLETARDYLNDPSPNHSIRYLDVCFRCTNTDINKVNLLNRCSIFRGANR